MKACTMANGAVFFIPDEIERETKTISYASFIDADVGEKPAKRTGNIFSRFIKRDEAHLGASHVA